MNVPPIITIGTSNWLQEPLEGFLHNSKSVLVAITSAFITKGIFRFTLKLFGMVK